MSRRPRRPKKDSNHRIVIDALETFGEVEVDATRYRYTCLAPNETIFALDISDLPGQVDWILFSTAGWFTSVEVKETLKGCNLTDGESSWLDRMPLLVADNAAMVEMVIHERMENV